VQPEIPLGATFCVEKNCDMSRLPETMYSTDAIEGLHRKSTTLLCRRLHLPLPLYHSAKRAGSTFLLHREMKDKERGKEGGLGGLGEKELEPN
jgi:hypothetical protein